MSVELELSKESKLRQLGKIMVETWKEYGVQPTSLQDKLQTWQWYAYPGAKGRTLYRRHSIRLGVSIQGSLDKRVVSIQQAETEAELEARYEKARRSVELAALYLWSVGEATGPQSSLSLSRQASKADSLAAYLAREGNEEGAAAQKERARVLRMASKGEVELMPKKVGVIDKLRGVFAKVDVDGKLAPRTAYISAGVAAGIHPGTCAVQYARWKREKQP